jgi:hypothetical protein
MSILQTIGNDVKRVFAFLGSPKAQAIVTAGESLVEDVDPALTGAFNLANNWLAEIFKAQALGSAAAAGASGDVQKAAMVTAAVTPQVTAYLQANGTIKAPTAQMLQKANDGLVQFLDAIGAEDTAPAQPAA